MNTAKKETPTMRIQVFEGPNLYSPHKVIMGSYQAHYFGENEQVSNAEFLKMNLLGIPDLCSKIESSQAQNIHDLLLHLLRFFLSRKDYMDLKVTLDDVPASVVQNSAVQNKQKQFMLDFVHTPQGILIVKTAINIASFVKSQNAYPPKNLLDTLENIFYRLESLTPTRVDQEILLAAKQLNIPYQMIGINASLVLYGQASRSLIFNNSCTEFDSNIGFNLQKDKSKTHHLVKILGYPVTEQMIVSSVKHAQQSALKLGFPVVIKPLDEGRGAGVSADIYQHEQVAEAYQKAASFSGNRVIVEKFVEGDDHRITVAKGRVSGIARRRAASVLGDGKNSLAQLIDIKNNERIEQSTQQTTLKTIDIDDDLKKILKYKNLDLNSVPKVDEIIYLRSNANLSTGGELTIINEQDVHPDNLHMAVEIAKAFRLDSAGLDFITPNIALSWQEVGTVIELNAYPMLSERLASKLLENHFNHDNNFGRIPCTLVVSNNKNSYKKIIKDALYFKAKEHHYVGFANSETAELNKAAMKNSSTSVYKNCLTLLASPSCDKMLVQMSPQEIIEQGLPIDYFDLCLIDQESDINSSSVTEQVNTTSHKENLSAWLSGFVGEIKPVNFLLSDQHVE